MISQSLIIAWKQANALANFFGMALLDSEDQNILVSQEFGPSTVHLDPDFLGVYLSLI